LFSLARLAESMSEQMTVVSCEQSQSDLIFGGTTRTWKPIPIVDYFAFLDRFR